MFFCYLLLQQFLESRKRSLATSSPKAPSDQLLGQGSQQNGFGDPPPSKRPCTSTEVKVQISTGNPDHQTKVVVQTTIESTGDVGKNGVSDPLPDHFMGSPGSGNFENFEFDKLLEEVNNDVDLDDLLANVVNNPTDVAALEAQLARIEEETRKTLNEEYGEVALANRQQQAQQPDSNPGNDLGTTNNQEIKGSVDVKPKIEPSSYDPNMTAPPNTVATEASDNKSGPLPGIKNLIGGSRDFSMPPGGIKLEKGSPIPSNSNTPTPNSCAPNYPMNQSVPSSMPPVSMPQQQLASMAGNVQTTLGRTNTISVSVQNQVRAYPTPVGMPRQQQNYPMNNVGNQQQQHGLTASGTNNSMQTQFANHQQQTAAPGRLPGFGSTFQTQVAAGSHPMQQQQQQFKREQYSQDNPLVNRQQQNMTMPMQQFTHPQQQQQPQVQLTPQQQQQLRKMQQHRAMRQLMLRRQLHQQMQQRGPPPRYNEQHRTFPGMMAQQPQQQAAGNLMHRGMSPGVMGQTMPGGVDPTNQGMQQVGNNMMRTNHLMPQGNAKNPMQLQQMYQNQTQVQFLQQQQRQQQMMQNMHNAMPNPQQQQMNPMAMGKGPQPNATMGPSGPFMKQIRSQNHANMWPNQMHGQVGGNAPGASNMSIRQQLSSMVRFQGGRFPTQTVSTSSNMQTYPNISSHAANLHPSMINHQQQQQQQQPQQQPAQQGYLPGPQQLRPQGNATQLNQSQPNMAAAAAANMQNQGSTGMANQQYTNNALPLDNLLDNNMPNSSDFDLELLENILKNKD